MSKKPTCFVISPIGPDGSEVRASANNFLELLVEPALQRFDFEVTRADRIPHPSAITSDIVRLVQESDLCIIDLTGNNPNVFYECGRRHETGKPFIQLVEKGKESALPFDVSGIRTISYDLSTARSTLDAQRKLQEFVETLLANGFQQTTTGDSMSSLAQALERIERKVTTLMTSGVGVRTSTRSSDESGEDGDGEDILAIRMLPPREGFLRHMQRGNIDEALRLVPKLEKVLPFAEFIAALGLPASLGDQRAFELFDTALRKAIANPALLGERVNSAMKSSAQVVQNYFGNIGEASSGQKYLEDILGPILAADEIPKEAKANFANKLGMIAWSADDVSTSIRGSKTALELFPEPSFAYNLALGYERAGMQADLAATLARLASFSDLDGDHRKLLRKHGLAPKA